MSDANLSDQMRSAEIDYLTYTDEDLWALYCQMTLKFWGPIDRDSDDEENVTFLHEPDQEWATKREPVGLALIDRGYSARELLRGYPDNRV